MTAAAASGSQAEDEGVPAWDGLVRRIKPPPHEMCVIDEGNGGVTVNRCAFIFQPDGCSVYQSSVLASHGMSEWDAADENEWPAVVPVQAAQIDFSVRQNPWPDGRDGAHPRDVAHALIINSNDLGRKKRSKAVGALARRTIVIRPGERAAPFLPPSEG